MDSLVYPAILVLLTAAFAVVLRHQRARLSKAEQERDQIEVEEHRMFDFLHGLGESLQEDSSPPNMHRYIVEGVVRVVGAEAGILYLFDADQSLLVPVHLTRPELPVVNLPQRVLDRAAANPKSIRSHLRLATARVDEGFLGAVMEEQKPVLAADLTEHPGFDGTPNSRQSGLSVMAAPLTYGQKLIGVLAVGAKREERSDKPRFSANDFDVFTSAAEQSSFALGSAIIHAEAAEKRRLEDELRNASEIQRVLLPKKPPGLNDYRVAAMYHAAKLVSGDYYDYVPVDRSHHGVVIGDVCGKGIPASLIMAMCRSVLRAEARGNHSAAAVLGAVNRSVFPDIREDMFISLLYLVLEKDSSRITYCRAGHEPPLIYRKSQEEVEMPESGGIAVGIDAGDVFDRVSLDQELELAPGDVLLLYTDGVTEATNADGDEFGRDRLIKSLRLAAARGAEGVVEGIARAVNDFRGDEGQSDDITLIAVEKR